MNGKALYLRVTKSTEVNSANVLFCACLNYQLSPTSSWAHGSPFRIQPSEPTAATELGTCQSNGFSSCRKETSVAGCAGDTLGFNLVFKEECSKCLAVALFSCKKLKSSDSHQKNNTLRKSRVPSVSAAASICVLRSTSGYCSCRSSGLVSRC